MRITLLVSLAAIALTCCSCRREEPDPPGYSLTIPDDVPGEIEYTDKEGKTTVQNGRLLYADGHKHGWKKCHTEYQSGRLDVRDPLAYEAFWPCDYPLWLKGYKDGFLACQRTLPGADR
ncbi:MAG: hypothetical protein ACRC8S_02470 [Fimbriiglobus sp.]